MSEDKTIGKRRRRAEADEQLDVHSTGKDNRSNKEMDIHSTGKANRRDNVTDIHSTGKANRRNNVTDIHSTGKANRSNNETDIHSTGKANRNGLQPFEQKTQGARRLNHDIEAKATGNLEWPSEFILEGIKYKNEGILSDSSGEAIVFTVSRNGKKYALKLYYYDPDHRPNHRILEKVKSLGGSGLLVNIVSHGEWRNPSTPEEINDYELMDYCEGGSLEDVILAGDEKSFAEVAVRMGAAIDFLSKHGIIHRDIKPANFFYADKARTQIVLADFGISAECPEGGTCKIDEMRSPLYASPEFYTNVPGQPAEVGVESDYFSLGVSLLCLWVGKAKLTANESQLLRSKLNETLPIPKEMSDHDASLIKALTRLKMADRANFDDIKRWVKGENLGSEHTEAVDSNFNVVYNSSKNQVAHSPAELASFLVQDKVLGKKYIYSGRVTRWLEETGRNEIAVNVEEIVEKIYPKNQEAGLMAVAYMLDPAMDYVAPDGTHLTDPAAIALHVYENKQVDEVLKPDSNMMVYFKTLKLEKTLAAIKEFLSNGEPDASVQPYRGFLATYYLAVLLNSDIPFPVFVNWELKEADDIDMLLAAYNKCGYLDSINKALLKSRAFIVWLSYRNPALAGKVRMLHDNATTDEDSLFFNSSSAYRIAYELNPECDLFFNTDTSASDRCYTISQIGKYLNSQINEFVTHEEKDEDAALNDFIYMDESEIGDYLRARGEQYANFLKWNRYCMDIDDDENEQKAGPYNYLIGAYKSMGGFTGEAPEFPLGDKILTSIEDVKQLPRTTVAAAIEDNDYEWVDYDTQPSPFAAWLTAFFQENPKLDLSEKFTYEKETAKYIEFISQYAPDNYYAKRYNNAIRVIDQAAGKLKQSDKKTKSRRNIYLTLCAIPTLALILCMIFLPIPEVNPIKGHYLATAGLVFLAIFIPYVASENFSEGFLWGIIGGFAGAGIIYAGFNWFPTVIVVILGLVAAIAAIYYARKLLNIKNQFNNNGQNVRGDEFEYRQLDALYFAYHQTDNKLDNVITKYSSWQRNSNKIARGDYDSYGWSWLGIIWPIVVLWFFITPQISGANSWTMKVMESKAKENLWVLGTWATKYASGSTSIVCHIDSIDKHNEIFGTMEIAGQAPVAARGTVKSKSDTIPNKFSMWPIEEGSKDRKCLNFSYDKSRKKVDGTYYDRKGISHKMLFLSTPLAPWFIEKEEAPAKEISTNKKNNTSKSSKSSKKEKASEKTTASKSENTVNDDAASSDETEQTESNKGTFWQDTM